MYCEPNVAVDWLRRVDVLLHFTEVGNSRTRGSIYPVPLLTAGGPGDLVVRTRAAQHEAAQRLLRLLHLRGRVRAQQAQLRHLPPYSLFGPLKAGKVVADNM